MASDRIIQDLNKKVDVSLTCHRCGYPVTLGQDAKNHEYCSEDGKKLAVDVDWDNLEEW